MIESPADGSYLVHLDDGLLRVTFNRPDHGNSIPPTAVSGLVTLFQAAQADASIRCILIDGRGKIFSAGADVAGFAKSITLDVKTRQADFAQRLQLVGRLVESIVEFNRPIVVAIRGAVAGAGLLYPLVADYVIGDASAMFIFAHQKVGLSPDGGVSYLLPQVVGVRTARTLLLTAAKLDAVEAHRLGILTRVVRAEDLESECIAVSRSFSRAPQRAVAAAKCLINAARGNSLDNHLRAEAKQLVACVGDADFTEGVNALVEKRRADFPSSRTAST